MQEAADDIGVNVRTAYRIKNKPEFAQLYEAMKARRNAVTASAVKSATQKIDEAAGNIADHLEALTLKAAQILMQRLTDSPDEETTRDIVGIMHIGVQRLGSVREWGAGDDPADVVPKTPEELAAFLADAVPAEALKAAAEKAG